jgi:hypothetical protein
MATEVKHGPNPTFDAEIGGEFSLTLVGHHTTTPDLAAGGVTAVKYDSGQDGKRRAELLAMRTIFLEWWVAEWVARGGVFEEGVAYLVGYPFRPPTL